MTGSALKKATNVSLDIALVDEARLLGVNLSRACERGLAEEIAEQKRRRWLEESREAIAWSNDYVEKHGLPLEKYRQF
ncbi:MAG: type II toxin-antitoxin system CcdA family antitoxin [Sphingomonadaceae bacterium]|nr:type II toxin-antitoxin system CcdA family antitoxin [Sphingomonadaceae bacterium]